VSLAVGIDLVAEEDVAAALSEDRDRYLARVYTSGEVRRAAARPGALAACFAAKEAAVKALRPDRDEAVPWADVELVGDAIELHGQAAKLARRRGIDALRVGFSRQTGYACAVVVATGGT